MIMTALLLIGAIANALAAVIAWRQRRPLLLVLGHCALVAFAITFFH